jgi:hypothetical protein
VQGSRFWLRKITRKEQVLKCRSKVASHFKNYVRNKKCPAKTKKTPPNHMKRFPKKIIDHKVRNYKQGGWKKRQNVKLKHLKAPQERRHLEPPSCFSNKVEGYSGLLDPLAPRKLMKAS